MPCRVARRFAMSDARDPADAPIGANDEKSAEVSEAVWHSAASVALASWAQRAPATVAWSNSTARLTPRGHQPWLPSKTH